MSKLKKNKAIGESCVSVVIRAFNERERLPALLAALHEQRLSPAEIIVVDSGSFDGTPELAEKAGARVVHIDRHDFTFGYSLNVGVRYCEQRVVAIVSAHTLPLDRNWLTSLIQPFEEDSTAMVYGRQLGNDESKFSEWLDFLRTYGENRKVVKPPAFFANNANAAIRRNLWERYPFDETLPGLEDIAWAKYWIEQGYRVAYEPEAAVIHIHRETWRQVRRRYYREGVAAKRIDVKRRRGIPFVVAGETWWAMSDLWNAIRQRRLREVAAEIILFRFYKTLGTLPGLRDGALMKDPKRREAAFFDTNYKAVVIHGVRNVSLDEVPVPSVKPGDVLIKVAFEGVSAVDIEIYEGRLGTYRNGSGKYPIVPGHELSGKVMQAGANVDRFEIGDPVVVECIQCCGECRACKTGKWIRCNERRELGVIGCDGGYSEFVVVPGRFVHRLPDGCDLKKAALCEAIAVALKGIGRLSLSWERDETKRCAVVGVGPIGHLCARLLDLRGHVVTVFDRNPVRRSYFDDTKVSSGEDLAQLGEHDVIVDATGDPEALEAILHHSPPGASILLHGIPYAKREYSFEDLVAYDKTIIGSVGSSKVDFDMAISLLDRIDLDVLTSAVLPLDQYREAWERIRKGQALKVLLEVDKSL